MENGQSITENLKLGEQLKLQHQAMADILLAFIDGLGRLRGIYEKQTDQVDLLIKELRELAEEHEERGFEDNNWIKELASRVARLKHAVELKIDLTAEAQRAQTESQSA